MTGFDRVMVYRFAADGAGEVVAEACAPGIGRFLGLHYPASDIPAQARELYKRNLLRIITDVNADAGADRAGPRRGGRAARPVAVGAALGLADPHRISARTWASGRRCRSRSSSRANCGGCSPATIMRRCCPTLRATLGRASCSRRCSRCGWRAASGRRPSNTNGARATSRISCSARSRRTRRCCKDPDWLGDILTHAIPADGVGVWIAGNHAFSGDDARRPTISAGSSARSTARRRARSIATDHIAGAGRRRRSVSRRMRRGCWRSRSRARPRDYVVLFRSELVRSVRWAGDPHKPVEYGPNGPRLTPREELRRVEGAGRGPVAAVHRFRDARRRDAARDADRGGAAACRRSLGRAPAGERAAGTADRRTQSPRPQHPWRDPRADPPVAADPTLRSKDYVKMVDGRIHALARAHNQITDDHWGPAPMQALIDAEAAAFVDEQTAWSPRATPVLLNPQAYSTMALVIHELVTNSTKYGSLSAPEGRVRIELAPQRGRRPGHRLAGKRRAAGAGRRHARASARRSSTGRCPMISAGQRRSNITLERGRGAVPHPGASRLAGEDRRRAGDPLSALGGRPSAAAAAPGAGRTSTCCWSRTA